MALSRLLGNYYIEHPGSENEVLLQVAGWIQTYCLVLEDAFRAPSFDKALVTKLTKALEEVDQEEARVIGELSRRIANISKSKDPGDLRKEYMHFAMGRLNMHADLSRSLLKVRHLMAQGALKAEIDKVIHERSEKLF